MPHPQTKFSHSCAARVITAAGSILVLSMAMTAAAEARSAHGGGHGFHHGLGVHEMHSGDGGASFAGDHRHGNDAYVNAASEEEDKLLNTKLKSICHGR
jgi:hypothetical protein